MHDRVHFPNVNYLRNQIAKSFFRQQSNLWRVFQFMVERIEFSGEFIELPSQNIHSLYRLDDCFRRSQFLESERRPVDMLIEEVGRGLVVALVTLLRLRFHCAALDSCEKYTKIKQIFKKNISSLTSDQWRAVYSARNQRLN